MGKYESRLFVQYTFRCANTQIIFPCRCRQLEQALSSVQAEKESLLHRAEAERSKAMRSKAELRRARSLVSDLSNQLASSYEAREDIAKSASK